MRLEGIILNTQRVGGHLKLYPPVPQRNSALSPLSMERVLEPSRRRLCMRVFRAEHVLLLKKNASTMNIAHVSMAQIAAPINVRADKVCYPTR